MCTVLQVDLFFEEACCPIKLSQYVITVTHFYCNFITWVNYQFLTCYCRPSKQYYYLHLCVKVHFNTNPEQKLKSSVVIKTFHFQNFKYKKTALLVITQATVA